MSRYREERYQSTIRRKNTMCSQMVQSKGSTVHSEHDLFTTGPYTAILIKGSIKEGPG